MHVVATAGHVDHGKSMLVRALTGMEPDRWEAERRRGMTIDLGYAWTTLPSGGELAFVDVPGHERFITNMLAGVGPAPAVMFVVAADGGWMPQSAEHLAAIDALGGPPRAAGGHPGRPGRPGTGAAAGRPQVAGTSLGGVEAVAVSAVTGQGLPELTAALGRLTARLPEAGPAGRAFGCGWTGCSPSRAAGPWSPGPCRQVPCRPETNWCSPRSCAPCGSGACSRSAYRPPRSAVSPGWR